MDRSPIDETGFFCFISTNDVRSHLSEVINRAAYGKKPVVVTRRGRKIAAIVSFKDVLFLETMKRRREEVMASRWVQNGNVVDRLNAEMLFL